MTGYVKAQRNRFDHHLFRAEKFCRGYAWDWLVANAAFRDMQVDVGGKTVTLRRGQLCYSIRFLGEVFGWKKDAVSRFLARLKTETMIETDAATGQIIITICNYDRYQGEEVSTRDTRRDATRDTGETAPRQRRDSSATNKKALEEGKKDKKGEGSDKSDPPPTAAGLPDGFMEKLADALGFDPHADLPPMWDSKKGRAHVAAWLPVHGEERIIDVARESRRKHPEPPASPQALDPHLAKPPAAKPVQRSEPIEMARFWAEKINAGKFIAPSSINPELARLMLAEGLVTETALREKGIAA